MQNPVSEQDTAQHIMLVEDDVVLAEVTKEYLQMNGFKVSVESDGNRAVERILQEQPDLLILDVMLPGKDGIDICREVRKDFHSPIMMLTARTDELDQLLGLEIGADDYLCKPIKPRLLQARIKAMLRREETLGRQLEQSQEKRPQRVLEFDDLRIDNGTRQVTIAGEEIELATPEYDILHLLADNAGEIISREQVFEQVRGFEYDGASRFVDITISRIRSKLEGAAQPVKRIKTVRGKGYLFLP
ncbi:MAG: response regulator transcription factor [Pseudomonadales bacterium]|nr:response regulator transcription factor [Pseudomonadales bacterium]